MSRPAVSVVLPFHGTALQAHEALDALQALNLRDGDEIVVVDNTGAATVPSRDGMTVVAAAREHSSYHARNAGAAAAAGEWLLFVDSGCRFPADLLDRYFDEPVAQDCGALVGEIAGVAGQPGLVPAYARSRRHLGQDYHFHYPFRPFGVTANLLVRRTAWESIGGFQEGVRSTGDIEFCWRLQDAGWTLGFRPRAAVEHHHRESVGALVRQAARYGAGQAWIHRRYPQGMPAPSLARDVARAVAGIVVWTLTGRMQRAVFKALDGLYVLTQSGAWLLPNRPAGARAPVAAAGTVVVAGEWPEDGATAAAGERVEALRRPVRVDFRARAATPHAYAEDDGLLERAAAAARLVLRRPVRAARHARRHRREAVPGLLALAPVAERIAASGARDVRALDERSASLAVALRELSGR